MRPPPFGFCVTVTLKTACDRDEVAFASVKLTVRLLLPSVIHSTTS